MRRLVINLSISDLTAIEEQAVFAHTQGGGRETLAGFINVNVFGK